MRRGEAPVAVAEETCVLGHAWQDGRVLCPVCGFGRRVTPVDGEAEAVTVTAVVAMPAARAGEVTSATVSPDGHWAWDGDEWVPASMSTIGASAAATAAERAEQAEQAEIPAARAPMVLATGEDDSTWASRDMPRSLRDPGADPDYVPTYEDSPPPPIPMPSDATGETTRETTEEVDAEAAHAGQPRAGDSLQDLARLLALADVPDEDDAEFRDDDRAGGSPAVALEPSELEPVALEPVALEPEPVEVVPAVQLAPVEPAPTDTELTDPELTDPGLTDPELTHSGPVDAPPVEETAVEETAPPALGEAFLEPYLEFEGPVVPAEEPAAPPEPVAEEPELVAASSSIADTTPAAEPAAAKPITVVLRPSTATQDDDETGREEDARPRRSLRTPDLHLSPNGLRVAVVVVAAVVSTVIATGHSPFAHHTSAAPTVDTVLQGTLEHAAVLESRYASEHGDAGLSAATLTPGGYRTSSTVSLTVARTAGQGFCLVGSGPVAGSHAYELWDSARGGLVSAAGRAVSFPTLQSAQLACHGAGAFQPL